MRIEDIRNLKRHEECFPFTLFLQDGKKISVSRREAIAIGKNVVTVVGARDQVYVVDPQHIVSIRHKPRRS